MRRRLLVYGTAVIAGTLVLLGGLVYSQSVPAHNLWFRKCQQVTENPTPSNPLDGCKREGWNCAGGCAVGGTITYSKCVKALFSTCNERLVEKTVTVPHVPCLPIEGAGGAGCKCDTSVPPVNGPVKLYLKGC